MSKLVKKHMARFDKLILEAIRRDICPKSKEELRAIFKEHDTSTEYNKGAVSVIALSIAACAAWELHAQYGEPLPPGMRDESDEQSQPE